MTNQPATEIVESDNSELTVSKAAVMKADKCFIFLINANSRPHRKIWGTKMDNKIVKCMREMERK